MKPRYRVDRHTIGEALPLGRQKYAVLSPDDFTQMKECWAVEYQSFRRVYDAYNAYVDKMRRHISSQARRRIHRRTEIPSIADWEPHARLNFDEKQLAMRNISPVVMVYINYTHTVYALYTYYV